ncbi:MAG: hypothetical protein HFG73_01025 [Hungatella sp.]|nr:hypothetical protein [Hungatella sp.]
MGHSTKKLNLAGQIFGKLTVLEPAGNIGTKTAWLCRCQCGKELVVKTCYLRNGHVVSCGCAQSESRRCGLASLTYVDGTCVEMLRARTIRRNNTSGVPGVDWRPSKGTWRASICFKGKRYYLGSFRRFEDAVEARKHAEQEMHDGFLSEFATAQAEKIKQTAG